jgi:hypothetical protein
VSAYQRIQGPRFKVQSSRFKVWGFNSSFRGGWREVVSNTRSRNSYNFSDFGPYALMLSESKVWGYAWVMLK